MLSFILVMIIVGLFFGLVAGLYANKSSLESWQEPAPTASWAFHLIIGAALSFIFALGVKLHFAGVNLWIFTAMLVAFAILQSTNKEGKYRMGAWGSLSLLTCGLLIFTITSRLDELKATSISPALFLFLIPMILPFVVGAIQVSRIERGIGLEGNVVTAGEVDFTRAVVAIAAIAIGVIVLVGLCSWAFS